MIADTELRKHLVARAQEVAKEREWTLLEPIEITSGSEAGEAVWIIRSNSQTRGRNASIVVRRSDHALVRAGYLAR
jgi:hypothetical protein